MIGSWFKKSVFAIAGAGLLAGGAATAQAGSLLNVGGWNISWDAEQSDPAGTYVTVTLLTQSTNAIVLQKVGVFADGPDKYGLIAPLELNFQQVEADALPYIIITSEQITNASGTDWSSFKFIIEDGTTGDPTKDVHFNIDETFNDVPPFKISPFTSWVASNTVDGSTLPQMLTFSDGIVADGTIWTPGIGANTGGEVVINANPSRTGGSTRFVFKEQPIPTAIPLPAAAWMGLSSLAFLALPKAARKVRELAVA